MRAREAQIVATLVRWLAPVRREWRADVWTVPGPTTQRPISASVVVTHQWGDDAEWMSDRWQVETWRDVRSLAREMALAWWDAAMDVSAPIRHRLAPIKTFGRAVRRWWLLARGIRCAALTTDGKACRRAGEQGVTLSVGDDGETVTYHLCETHHTALFSRGGTMTFRDGLTLTTPMH